MSLDTTNASRGVWLVKVPKYMIQRWDQVGHNAEVGKLIIKKTGSGAKPQITFTLNDEVKNIKIPGEGDIPAEHKFVVSNVANQQLGILSQTIVNPDDDSVVPESEKLCLEGRVVQRAECRPQGGGDYMKLKREMIMKALEPTRTTQQLDRAVSQYKPKADHGNNIEFTAKKKLEGKKSRDDRDKVMDMLFSAFEKHQFYNIKDLVRITKQPVQYLKEILNDVCNYNLRGPHKNTWELKPEYRHYREDEEEDSSDDGDVKMK